MRKMKKINGYFVVKFNARELREWDGTGLGEYGVIDAELYTGILEIDRSAMEYDDAGSMEEAVELARGLESELEVEEPTVKITVIKETDEATEEDEVDPQLMIAGWKTTLEAQIKTGFKDVDKRTAAHELYGFKSALRELGLIEPAECRLEPDAFGEACGFYDDDGHHIEIMLPSPAGLALVSAHDYEEGETFTGCTVQMLKCRKCGRESFAWSKAPGPEREETLAYVCDELCKFREGRTQEELDAVCETCKLERLTGGARPRAAEPTNFEHLHRDIQRHPQTKKLYALGLALARECPDNDCRVYLNIFNMARELDAAIGGVSDYAAIVLRRDLLDRVRELGEMYDTNVAVQKFKEGGGQR